MKKHIKSFIILAATAAALTACKGGVSGEKQDSTMLDRETMDSSAALNHKAGTMAADSNSAARQDSSGLDSTGGKP
jgi:hypothetical protein